MKKKAFTLVEVMIVTVIIGLLVAIAVPAFFAVKNRGKNEPAQYSAWCKLHQRTDISFEEWRVLRNAFMLPEQSRNTSKP